MKDKIHHLKFLQKKVIQSSRRHESSELINNNDEIGLVLTQPSGGTPARSRKKREKNILHKSFIRESIH